MGRSFLSSGSLVALGVLFASGCLSGSYDQAYRTRLQEYRQDGEFQRLHLEAKALGGNRLVLRVPKLFQAEDAAGEKERSKPPFLQDFPAYAIAFETPIPAGDADPKPKFRAVLTVGVPTDKESTVEELKKRILGQVQAEPEFAKASWTQVDAQTRTAGVQFWSVLKLAGPQSFERVVAGNPETKNSAGETQIWVAADPASKVAAVLAWRVPEELEAAVPLEELAPLVARTVEFKPEPQPVADPAAPREQGQVEEQAAAP